MSKYALIILHSVIIDIRISLMLSATAPADFSELQPSKTEEALINMVRNYTCTKYICIYMYTNHNEIRHNNAI